MRLDAKQAAALCNGISAGYWRALTSSLRFRPIAERSGKFGRRVRHFWGIRHVVALQLVACLEGRLGVSTERAVAAVQMIAGHPSDEVCDATIQDRPFLLVVGPWCATVLVDGRQLRRADNRHGPILRAQGMELLSVDLRPLWDDVTAAAKQLIEQQRIEK